MPEEYKRTIRETFRKFPDVTFIWKYEVIEQFLISYIEADLGEILLSVQAQR